jgi:hypothetical protein
MHEVRSGEAGCRVDLSFCDLSFRAVTPDGSLSITELIRPKHIASVERMEPRFSGDHRWFVALTSAGAECMLDHTSTNVEGQIAMLCAVARSIAPSFLGRSQSTSSFKIYRMMTQQIRPSRKRFAGCLGG